MLSEGVYTVTDINAKSTAKGTVYEVETEEGDKLSIWGDINIAKALAEASREGPVVLVFDAKVNGKYVNRYIKSFRPYDEEAMPRLTTGTPVASRKDSPPIGNSDDSHKDKQISRAVALKASIDYHKDDSASLYDIVRDAKFLEDYLMGRDVFLDGAPDGLLEALEEVATEVTEDE